MYGMSIVQQPIVRSVNYYITRFDNESGPPAFKNISKLDFRRDMMANLSFGIPGIGFIAQRNASLCGPAAFFFSILRQRTELYVKAVTELYLYGITKLGNLVIIPSDSTKNVTLGHAKDIHGVDWVLLASLRDSENDNFRLDNPSDKIASITMPNNMIKWFKQVGATDVVHEYSIIFPKNFSNLAIANDYFNRNYSVCLFINFSMIADVMFTTPTPNHWVLLTSRIMSDSRMLTPALAKQLEMEKTLATMSASEQEPDIEYDLQFEVFTWGNEFYPVHRAKSDSKDIMNYYYGFVAARW